MLFAHVGEHRRQVKRPSRAQAGSRHRAQGRYLARVEASGDEAQGGALVGSCSGPTRVFGACSISLATETPPSSSRHCVVLRRRSASDELAGSGVRKVGRERRTAATVSHSTAPVGDPPRGVVYCVGYPGEVSRRALSVVEGGRRHERFYRGSRVQKRRSSTATSAATSTTRANATTVPQMNGSAVSAEPIRMATPTRKAIPPKMKTTPVTSLRVMMGGRSTPRSSTLISPVFPP
jgi:hypothetical protein